jgi:hypothetical protein
MGFVLLAYLTLGGTLFRQPTTLARELAGGLTAEPSFRLRCTDAWRFPFRFGA